jgi:hypothetical protein
MVRSVGIILLIAAAILFSITLVVAVIQTLAK